eukprot:SAG11_NODE_25381_length_359_cov_1.276923_1_plen_20_part_10
MGLDATADNAFNSNSSAAVF